MWQKTNGLVFSDWTERFLAVLVRNVPGPQVQKKSQKCLEIGKWVSRNWWSEIISSRNIFHLVSICFIIDHIQVKSC